MAIFLRTVPRKVAAKEKVVAPTTTPKRSVTSVANKAIKKRIVGIILRMQTSDQSGLK